MLTDPRFEWYFIEYFFLIFSNFTPVAYAVDRLLALYSLYFSAVPPSPTSYLLTLNLYIWETNTKALFFYSITQKRLKSWRPSIFYGDLRLASAHPVAKSTQLLWELFFFLFHAFLLPSLLCGCVSDRRHRHKSLYKWGTLLYNHW